MMRTWFAAMLLLLPLVLTSGCGTQALWTCSELDHRVKPAAKPNLRLYATSRQDFLVVYDENGHRKQIDRTRAYFLGSSQESIRSERAPRFVDADLAYGLPPVPVFCTPPIFGTNQPSRPFAVSDGKTNSFTIYFRDGGSNLYHLPVYRDHAVTFTRVALTPLAVSADAILIYALCMSHTSPTP